MDKIVLLWKIKPKQEIMYRVHILSAILFIASCQNEKKEVASVDAILIYNSGEISVYGEKVSLEDFKKTLKEELSEMSSIPETIPFKTEDEVLWV